MLASLGLYVYPLCYPTLVQDDFQILLQSWTWEKTWSGLWLPQNEHAMPLGRLTTYVVDQLADRPSALPLAAALVGPVGLLLGLPLLYRFVSRELGHPLYGLAALLLFGVTSVYQQAVYWFAASFSVLALDTLLLAMLAAQTYRRTGRPLHLGLCGLWCALSPCWFASGILAGPICCLYLLSPESGAAFATRGQGLRFWLLRTTPILGTAIFLAVSLPLTARTILHLEHYQYFHTNAVEAFRLDKGLVLTGKALVENLLLGLVGVCAVPVPSWLVVYVLLLATTAAAWWWWRAPDRRLLLVGFGLILTSYLLVYSARSRWFMPAQGEMAPINESRWSRYHLLPQLGLTLFICGGLPAWSGRCFVLRSDGSLTWKQARNVGLLIFLCFLVQLPRGILGAPGVIDFTDQKDALRHIEAVDACCRANHVGADTARRCLGELDIPQWFGPAGGCLGATAVRSCLMRFDIPWSFGSVNGWDFLHGSDDPLDRPDAEVKRILEGCILQNQSRDH
jgi:hypothetical protein